MMSLMKMNAKNVLMVFTMMLMIAGGSLSAQTMKIGYTDPELLIRALPAYKESQTQLQTMKTASENELTVLQETFQKKVADYQRQQAMLTAERKAAVEAELQGLQQEMSGKANALQEKLLTTERELLSPLYDKVQTAIDEVAKARGLAYVVRSETLLYVDDQVMINITDELATRLGLPLN